MFIGLLVFGARSTVAEDMSSIMDGGASGGGAGLSGGPWSCVAYPDLT